MRTVRVASILIDDNGGKPIRANVDEFMKHPARDGKFSTPNPRNRKTPHFEPRPGIYTVPMDIEGPGIFRMCEHCFKFEAGRCNITSAFRNERKKSLCGAHRLR